MQTNIILNNFSLMDFQNIYTYNEHLEFCMNMILNFQYLN